MSIARIPSGPGHCSSSSQSLRNGRPNAAPASSATDRVQFPFLVMLWNNLNREQMTVKFDPDPNGGTRVTITGDVARGNHAVAADPEHWSEALGGSTPAPQ